MGHKLKNEMSEPFFDITQDVKTRMISLLSSITSTRVKKWAKASFLLIKRFWYFSQGYRRITRNTFAFVRRIKNNETFVEFLGGKLLMFT